MKKSEEIATYHYNLAVQYEKEKKFEEAKREYQYASKCDEKFAYPHKGLAELYYKEGNLEMAIKELAYAVSIDPNWDEALSLLAEIFYEKKEIHKAIHFQEKALKAAPDNPNHYAILGKMYIAHKKYDAAIEILKKALEKDSTQYAARYNLGLAYAKRGMVDIENSLREWKESQKIRDDDINLHRNMGIIYYMKGMLDESENEFKAVLKMNKDDEVARKYIDLVTIFKNKEEKDSGNNTN